MYLDTARLLLRPVEYPDVDQLLALWGDPAVTRFAAGPSDLDRLRDSLDEQADSPSSGAFGLFPLIEKATGLVVGNCGLLETEIEGAEETEIVCVVAQRAWGSGYPAEVGEALLDLAFRVLALERVVWLIDPADDRSMQVAAELGMHRERLVERPEGERELWAVANRAG